MTVYRVNAESKAERVAVTTLDQVLLRRLQEEAPGTYHHSMLVGALAERAAVLTGRDSLLRTFPTLAVLAVGGLELAVHGQPELGDHALGGELLGDGIPRQVPDDDDFVNGCHLNFSSTWMGCDQLCAAALAVRSG